jgi:hypothetical protein
MTAEKMVYSDDELIVRIWDREHIRHTMNRFCYYLSNEEPRRAINELWVTKPDNRVRASLGYNTGFYRGLDEVARHLVVDREQRLKDNLRARAAGDPSLQGSGSSGASDIGLGYGCSGMLTLTTPLTILADDGMSARFVGYSLGYSAEGKPGGAADAYLSCDLLFADLLKEDGEWRILNLTFNHDHTIECGTSYADVPILGWDDPLVAREGEPTIKRTVYNPLYGWEYIYYDMPRPYYTYTDKDSYGPGGNLGKPYYERDPR